MPKKKISDPNKKLKLYTAIIVAAVCAAAGVIVLNKSSAASLTPPQQVGYLNINSVANNDGVHVFTSQDQVPGLGAQNVADITPGSQLTFVQGGKQLPTSICYVLRVYNSPKSAQQVTSASVTLVGPGSARTVTLPADDIYREVCVPSGRQTQLPYHVANLSSAAYVLVYQAVLHY